MWPIPECPCAGVDALGIPAAQVTAQVAAQVAAVLDAASSEARPREDLQAIAGMKHREHFRKAYVDPLVTAEWLQRTIPDKPTSRLQKYRVTDKGLAWLAEYRQGTGTRPAGTKSDTNRTNRTAAPRRRKGGAGR